MSRARVPSDVTTASSQVTVMVSTSPTPYAPSVAATLEKSGASPSTVTVPRSPPVMVSEALLPALSFIVAPPASESIEETERSVDVASSSAIVVVNTSAVEPDPLA